MALVRGLTAPVVVVSLLTAPLLAQPVPNWTAPRSWTPPRSAALDKLEKARGVGSLGIQSVPSGPLPFFAITPCRLVDTRPTSGFSGAYGPPALVANATRDFDLDSAPHCTGVRAGAQAYSLNVTVTETQGMGDIRIWPTGNFALVSTQNWSGPGVTLANAATVPAGTNGSVTVQAAGSGTHLIIDVNGYYAPASFAETKTVAVDCTAGQSLQAAIDRDDGPLVVDVHGICNENVSVKRKDVTLRGLDPATDGIQGVVAVPQFPALRFAYVDGGRLENLSISNGPGFGFSAFYSRLDIVNCRMNGNGGQGMVLEHSNVNATELTASQNELAGVLVRGGGLLFCLGCRFENNLGFAASASRGGFLTLNDSVVAGRRGLFSADAAYADIDCISSKSTYPCSLSTTGRAAQAISGGTVAVYGNGSFTGQVEAGDRGIVQLIGARQLATGQPGQGPAANSVGEFGMLSAGTDDIGQSQLFGTTNVAGFGRLILHDMTTLAGSIVCDSAGDAWLAPTIVANPGSSITGCEHGVLPP